jgi:hypothetical protein
MSAQSTSAIAAARAEHVAAMAASAAADAALAKLEAESAASSEPIAGQFAKLAAHYKAKGDIGFAKYPNFDHRWLLPIKKMCGISVQASICVFLSYDDNQRLVFEIKTERKRWNSDSEEWEAIDLFILHEPFFANPGNLKRKNRVLTLADYETMLELIYDALPKISLDPYHADFETDFTPAPIDEMTLLVSHDNTQCPICCCCRELNYGINTKCGHIVCLPCFDQLKTTVDDDGTQIIPCPLCRGEIGEI